MRAQPNLGLALDHRGDRRRAVVPLARALKLWPNLDVAAVELAMALDMLGRTPGRCSRRSDGACPGTHGRFKITYST